MCRRPTITTDINIDFETGNSIILNNGIHAYECFWEGVDNFVKKSLITISIFFLILIGPAIFAGPMPTCTFTPTPGGWCSLLDQAVTNAYVAAVTCTANDVYIGGTFTLIGPRTGGFVPVDNVMGNIIPGFPEFAGGKVYSIVNDGAGGWYVGGDFTYAAGIARTGLAHVFSNGALDPIFDPILTGNSTCEVHALAFDGTNVYAGGWFKYLGTKTIFNLLKIDGTSGIVDMSFNPNPSDFVYAIVCDGPSAFIGGAFKSVSNTAQGYLSKISLSNGALDPLFFSGTNSAVNSILTDTTSIYIGGEFTSVSGTARGCVAKINKTTGALDTSFIANATNTLGVYSLAINGTVLYIAGWFTYINGSNHYDIAKVDASTGTVDESFAATTSGGVRSVLYDASGLYIGGEFPTVDGKSRNYIAKIDPSTGVLDTTFNASANDIVYTLGMNGSGLYTGGNFSGMNAINRVYVAKINAATGAVDPAFNANISSVYEGDVLSLALDGGNNLYFGGDFGTVGGQPRNRLAKVNASTGALDTQYITSTYQSINSLDYDGTSLYFAENGIVKTDPVTGAWDATFNAACDSRVMAIKCDRLGSVYACGEFTTVGGTGAVYSSKINSATGAIDAAFNPAIGSELGAYAQLLYGGSLIIGGYFSSVGGQSREDLAKVIAADGSLDTSFTAIADNQISALSAGGGGLYVGGSFDWIAGKSISYLARLYPGGSVDTTFNAGMNGSLDGLAVSPDGNMLYAAGGFSMVSKIPSDHYAAIYIGNPPSQTLTPYFSPTMTRTLTNTITETTTITVTSTITESWTITQTSTISPTQTETDTETSTLTITPTATSTCSFTVTPTYETVVHPGDILIYPNPVYGGIINIKFEYGLASQSAEISIYTVNLRLIRKWNLSANMENQYRIDSTGLASGTYIIAARLSNEGTCVCRKVKPIVILR